MMSTHTFDSLSTCGVLWSQQQAMHINSWLTNRMWSRGFVQSKEEETFLIQLFFSVLINCYLWQLILKLCGCVIIEKCDNMPQGDEFGLNTISRLCPQRPHAKVMSWHGFCKHLVPVHILNDSQNLDNCSTPFSMIKQVHHLAKWTVDAGLQNCSSESMIHMFNGDWKQSAEDTLDPIVCVIQRVLVCFLVNMLDLCGAPLPCLISAPGISGLPPDMSLLFPPLRKQYIVHDNIKQLFRPNTTPLSTISDCCGRMMPEKAG